MIDWLIVGLLLAIWVTLLTAVARLRSLQGTVAVASDMNHEQQVAIVKELEDIQADVRRLRQQISPPS